MQLLGIGAALRPTLVCALAGGAAHGAGGRVEEGGGGVCAHCASSRAEARMSAMAGQ